MTPLAERQKLVRARRKDRGQYPECGHWNWKEDHYARCFECRRVHCEKEKARQRKLKEAA